MLTNVIEAMIDAVLVVDLEGRLVLTNAAASRLTGHTPEELQRVPIASLLVDEASGIRTAVRQRIVDGDPLRRETAWLVTKGGARIPVAVTGASVNDASGNPAGIVVVAHDIRELRHLLEDRDLELSRRRAVEQELIDAKNSIADQLALARKQLLLAERRATLGTLAGGVGHELRNIAQVLISVLGEIQFAIKNSVPLEPILNEALPDLVRVGDHITEHARRLLQLAKPGPDHAEQFDLGPLVASVISMLQGAGRFLGIDVTYVAPPSPFFVTVNRTRIEQILVNLIVNAADAIHERGAGRGEIGVSVQPSEDGARVVCVVSDTGVGIAPDQLERIFEPFFTTKGLERGTGLGLPVAREIVATYGGTLTVSSELGKGSRFTFDFPR